MVRAHLLFKGVDLREGRQRLAPLNHGRDAGKRSNDGIRSLVIEDVRRRLAPSFDTGVVDEPHAHALVRARTAACDRERDFRVNREAVVQQLHRAARAT